LIRLGPAFAKPFLLEGQSQKVSAPRQQQKFPANMAYRHQGDNIENEGTYRQTER
jgi:hypothetical protein